MKRILLAAALLSCSLAANADDLRAGTKQFSIFISDPSFTESSSRGSDVSGGTGIAFSYALTRQWSAQLSISAQEHRTYVTRFTSLVTLPDGGTTLVPVTTSEKVNTYPVELLGRYHFTNESRWTPFLGAGVRYVGAPDVPPSLPIFVPGIGNTPGTTFSTGPGYHNRLSGELAGGVSLRITKAVSLDLEARRLLRSEGVNYDPVNRGVIGVSWKW